MKAQVVVGFIPLLDCAPLIAAVEQGFAAQEGLELTLVRETSWAAISTPLTCSDRCRSRPRSVSAI